MTYRVAWYCSGRVGFRAADSGLRRAPSAIQPFRLQAGDEPLRILGAYPSQIFSVQQILPSEPRKGQSMDQATITAYGGVISAAVTAVATIFLWLVTRTLAKETKRMVEASSRPHVVATIEPSRWSMRHCELTVANTGNATAYDIALKFEPGIIPDRQGMKDKGPPLQNISVLKPDQSMTSYLNEFGTVMGIKFEVKITWSREPGQKVRETNVYTLNMAHLEGMVRLGSSDPLVQIAEDIRKIRDDWRSVASGSRRISADIFTQADRERSQEEHREMWLEAERAEKARLEAEAETSNGLPT